MWHILIEWLKGVFGAKGTTQIGSGNKSISGVTIGNNAGGIVVGDKNVAQVANQQPPSGRGKESAGDQQQRKDDEN
jgi:hypothetical protein